MSMREPLISICIPAFNALKYIVQTLDSVKSQTYENWELIIVEDASLDGTKEIVEEYAKLVQQKVRYFRNEKTRGPAGSRNVAATNSSGEWIAFLDSDDIWKPDHLAELLKTAFKYPDCDLIHGCVEVFDSESKKIIFTQRLTAARVADFPISLFSGRYGFMPSQTIVSRKLFEVTGGFNETVRFGIEDLEFWFKCARANFKFALSEKQTCLYRQNKPEALTSNALGMALGSAEVYDIYANWKQIPKKLRHNHASQAWLSVARIARKKNIALARKCIVKSIKYRVGLKQLFFWAILNIPAFK